MNFRFLERTSETKSIFSLGTHITDFSERLTVSTMTFINNQTTNRLEPILVELEQTLICCHNDWRICFFLFTREDCMNWIRLQPLNISTEVVTEIVCELIHQRYVRDNDDNLLCCIEFGL